jgi:methylenetetrahydrofolate dehydrogenase (NADP+)/methenyltetrahydrofolate cyclohydrolase
VPGQRRRGRGPASASYLDSIDKLAAKLGIESRRVALPEGSSEAAVCAALDKLGADDAVHAILLQFPLPEGLDARARAAARAAAQGRRRHHRGQPRRRARRRSAATPRPAPRRRWSSCSRRRAPLARGRHVVVVGRSLVVGRPLAAMLAAPLPGGQATVTVCHTRTQDLGVHTRRADIIVVAAGRRALLQPGQVAPGAIVVDVGTHPVPGAGGAWTLAGDVDPEVGAVAGWLTPVPGGVGPVTNAVLMRHVTAAAIPGTLAPAW